MGVCGRSIECGTLLPIDAFQVIAANSFIAISFGLY